MSVSKIATAAIMAMWLTVPTLAQAAPAASRLAVSAPVGAAVGRVGAHTTKGNQAAGSTLFIIIALIAVGAGIAAATSNNNKTPTSA